MSAGARMALNSRFHVDVSGISLGGWASCKGLAVTFDSENLAIGGNYNGSWVLPTRLSYSNITLVRAITPDGTKLVQDWLRKMKQDWMNSDDDHDLDTTATITLMDTKNNFSDPVATWKLERVYPKSWRGPDMDAGNGGIATETLELIHQGFL